MIEVRLVMSAHPWFNGMNYGFSSCRWEARYKIEVVIQTSLWPFTGWTGYSINRKGQHLDRGLSRGITTPDSSLLFEVADSMTKEGTLLNILCTRMSIAPYKCSIMLMTCLFLFLFFLCHFLFLCHIHLQLRLLLLSSPLFLASFIFRHFADRCKWNERQVLIVTFLYRQFPDERMTPMLAAVCSWLSLFQALILRCFFSFLTLREILEIGRS